jgi:hypothetical protein
VHIFDALGCNNKIIFVVEGGINKIAPFIGTIAVIKLIGLGIWFANAFLL